MRSSESKWKISISLSKITGASLIVLSNWKNDENSEASVDEASKVEEDKIKASFKCEVAELRWSSNAFSQNQRRVQVNLK